MARQLHSAGPRTERCSTRAPWLASIPVRDAEIEDTSAAIVGAIFGLASIVSTVGFLVVGRATLRAGVWHDWRRFSPLTTGIWLTGLTTLSLEH